MLPRGDPRLTGTMEIRVALESDAGALARMAEETFRTTFAASNPADNMQRHCESSYGESIQLAEIRDPTLKTWLAEDVVWLGVWEHNPRAIAFYRKWGFEVVGEHIFMMGDDPQRDLLMRRVLRSPSPRG